MEACSATVRPKQCHHDYVLNNSYTMFGCLVDHAIIDVLTKRIETMVKRHGTTIPGMQNMLNVQ